MAFTWNQPGADDRIIADRALYLDKTESIVVEEGDPRSAFQLTGPGRPLEHHDVQRLGLVLKDGKIVQDRALIATKVAELRAAWEKSEAERRAVSLEHFERSIKPLVDAIEAIAPNEPEPAPPDTLPSP